MIYDFRSRDPGMRARCSGVRVSWNRRDVTRACCYADTERCLVRLAMRDQDGRLRVVGGELLTEERYGGIAVHRI